jgi:hypothetical protein
VLAPTFGFVPPAAAIDVAELSTDDAPLPTVGLVPTGLIVVAETTVVAAVFGFVSLGAFLSALPQADSTPSATTVTTGR